MGPSGKSKGWVFVNFEAWEQRLADAGHESVRALGKSKNDGCLKNSVYAGEEKKKNS